MEELNCSEMNNSELKEYAIKLENEFNAKKAKIKEMCEELKAIEIAFGKVQTELNIRKTIY